MIWTIDASEASHSKVFPKCLWNENWCIQTPQKRLNPGVQVLITPKIKTQNKRHRPSVVHEVSKHAPTALAGLSPLPRNIYICNLLKDAPDPRSGQINIYNTTINEVFRKNRHRGCLQLPRIHGNSLSYSILDKSRCIYAVTVIQYKIYNTKTTHTPLQYNR
jgi:hypothetical protein